MENDLNLYHIFYTVANTGNISHAARQLFISQPSLSKSISRLETQLNTQLFIRTSRGVRLTEEGRLLYEHIKTAFEALQQGEEQLKRRHDPDSAHLRIGVSTTLCKYRLLPYLKYFTEHFPNVQITIQCQSSGETLALLDQSKIDLGFVGLPDRQTKYHFYALEEISDIFVAAPAYMAHMQQQGFQTMPQLFQNASLMLLDKQNITRQFIDDYLDKNHLTPNNPLVVTTMDLLIDFSKIGLGIGCVIKEFVENELKNGQLTEINLDMPLPRRSIGFITGKQQYFLPSVENFINHWYIYQQMR